MDNGGDSSQWVGGEMSQEDFMVKDNVIVVDYKDNVEGSCSKAKGHNFDKGQPRGILHRWEEKSRIFV